MILSEVKYDHNRGYELRYSCHSCRVLIPNNRFKYCPNCGVKLVKDGHPERLTLDEGDICGLIALAITNGGFNESGINYMKDGKHYSVEGPGNCGMVFASWNKETQVAAMLKRDKKGGAE